MKFRKLLLMLFVLYWTVVYGASFITSKSSKNRFKAYFPTGYRMYAPATTTNYDVVYEFCSGGKIIDKIQLSEEFEALRKSSVLNDKEAFVKRRIFLESLKAFDYEYQSGILRERKDSIPFDFEKKVSEDEYLSKIDQSLQNYIKLYQSENPELIFDSVKISAVRMPIILEFNPAYRGSFTYSAGEGVFYEKWVK